MLLAIQNLGFEEQSCLELIFEDGEFTNEITLTEIRKRLSTITN